jgi:hypothetical protein
MSFAPILRRARFTALASALVLAAASAQQQNPAPIPARPAAPSTAAAARPRFMLVVHGGAGTITRAEMTPQMDSAYRATLTRAIRAGYDVLERGGASLDAVTAVIRILEDSPLFNAGKGAVFTNAGTNELDAAIMDGRTLKAGAVAGLKHVKNPIELARTVMERSPHVMMVGDGAEAFAPVPFVWSDQYDTKIQTVGCIRGDDEVVIEHGSIEERRFVALFGRAGRLTGAIGFSRPRDLMRYRRLLADGSSFAAALAEARR